MILNHKKEFILRALLIFIGCFAVISTAVGLIVGFSQGIDTAIPLAIMSGLFMSLFITAHLSRNFAIDMLEINQNNREKNRTMESYLRDIDRFLQHLRYHKHQQSDQLLIYHPIHRLHIISGDILVKKSLYTIEVQGPKFIITLLSSQLGLKKIIL